MPVNILELIDYFQNRGLEREQRMARSKIAQLAAAKAGLELKGLQREAAMENEPIYKETAPYEITGGGVSMPAPHLREVAPTANLETQRGDQITYQGPTWGKLKQLSELGVPIRLPERVTRGMGLETEGVEYKPSDFEIFKTKEGGYAYLPKGSEIPAGFTPVSAIEKPESLKPGDYDIFRDQQGNYTYLPKGSKVPPGYTPVKEDIMDIWTLNQLKEEEAAKAPRGAPGAGVLGFLNKILYGGRGQSTPEAETPNLLEQYGETQTPKVAPTVPTTPPMIRKEQPSRRAKAPTVEDIEKERQMALEAIKSGASKEEVERMFMERTGQKL